MFPLETLEIRLDGLGGVFNHVSDVESNFEHSYSGRVSPDLLVRLQSELLQTDEADRYRLFSSILATLADKRAGQGNGREAADAGTGLGKKLQLATEEIALLKDEIATLKADLGLASKQLAEEQNRNQEFRKTIEGHRLRLEESRKKEAELEAELVAKNSALHKAETESERFQLQAQRMELATQDMSRIDALEAEKRSQLARITDLERTIEQLRADKDREIDNLKGNLAITSTQTDRGADEMLAALWDRLGRAKPPLAEGHVKPTRQAAEKLFDALIELAYFSNAFENQMRPFLDRYTRQNELVAKPWKVYRSYEDVFETIVKTLAVAGGKPVGVLKMRLRELNKWTIGALMGGDAVVESVGAELKGFLQGPAGMSGNPNLTVKDFLRNDGDEMFRDHMLKFRSEKLSEVFKLTSM